MASIDEILAKAESPAFHRVVTARIFAVPQDLRDEHAALEALLPTLVSDTIDAHPDRMATAERLAEIEAEMAEALIEFRFRSIGHKAWADLLREHPPTKDQMALARNLGQGTLDHNPETFPYEAMAASCIDPVMSADAVRRLEASEMVDVVAWTELWGGCLRANVMDAVPKSIAASILLQSVGSAKRRITTGSPAASSSAE